MTLNWKPTYKIHLNIESIYLENPDIVLFILIKPFYDKIKLHKAINHNFSSGV